MRRVPARGGAGREPPGRALTFTPRGERAIRVAAALRRACIDIGSNTTRLLVADLEAGRLEPVAQERVFTHIGYRREGDRAIDEAKIQEVARVVADQVRTAQRLGSESVRAVATAAIRDACNGSELAEAVAAASGVQVDILSGQREARLAFLGAVCGVAPIPVTEIGVVDVGGGSCEIAVGRAPDRISWSASFRLGSGSLTREYLRSDPPVHAELAAARKQIAVDLATSEMPRPGLALAVGGSATSLRRLAGAILDQGSLERALAVLSAQPAAASARQFGLDADRARLLPAGLLILQAAAERFGRPLVVGGGGLREGVLREGVLREGGLLEGGLLEDGE